MSAVAKRRAIYLVFGALPAVLLAGVAAVAFLPALLEAPDFAILAVMSIVGVKAGADVIFASTSTERRWLVALKIIFCGLVPLSFLIALLDRCLPLQVILVGPWLIACALLVELWRQPNRPPKDVKRFLAGLAFGAVCTFILLSGRYDDSFVDGFAAELRSTDGPVDLRKHTDFAWDRVYVLGPYQTAWSNWPMLGYPWLKCSLISPMFDDREVGWVFVRNGLVTRYASVSRHALPFPTLWQFDSTDTRFRILKKGSTDPKGLARYDDKLSIVQLEKDAKSDQSSIH